MVHIGSHRSGKQLKKNSFGEFFDQINLVSNHLETFIKSFHSVDISSSRRLVKDSEISFLTSDRTSKNSKKSKIHTQAEIVCSGLTEAVSFSRRITLVIDSPILFCLNLSILVLIISCLSNR